MLLKKVEEGLYIERDKVEALIDEGAFVRICLDGGGEYVVHDQSIDRAAHVLDNRDSLE